MKITGLKAMLHNRLHREDIYSEPEFWDTKASDLDGKAVSMWPNNSLNDLYHAEQLQTIKQLAPNVQDLKILDIGCGIGRMSRYFAKQGAQVTGSDFSAKTVEIARAQSEGNNPSYRVESLYDLEEQDTYDLIVSWGVVTVACRNAQELSDIAHRIHRALKPTGSLIFLEPIHKGFLHRVLDLPLKQFLSIFEQAGFRIDKVHHLHFWPARLCLAYIPWPRFLTLPCYHIGQWIMRTIFNMQAMGDYKGIKASVAQTPQ